MTYVYLVISSWPPMTQKYFKKSICPGLFHHLLLQRHLSGLYVLSFKLGTTIQIPKISLHCKAISLHSEAADKIE